MKTRDNIWKKEVLKYMEKKCGCEDCKEKDAEIKGILNQNKLKYQYMVDVKNYYKEENQKLKESLDKLEKDIERLGKLNIENYNDFVKIQIENQKLKETIEKVETIIWLKKNDGDWMDYSYGYIYNEIKKLVKQEKKQ